MVRAWAINQRGKTRSVTYDTDLELVSKRYLLPATLESHCKELWWKRWEGVECVQALSLCQS